MKAIAFLMVAFGLTIAPAFAAEDPTSPCYIWDQREDIYCWED